MNQDRLVRELYWDEAWRTTSLETALTRLPGAGRLYFRCSGYIIKKDLVQMLLRTLKKQDDKYGQPVKASARRNRFWRLRPTRWPIAQQHLLRALEIRILTDCPLLEALELNGRKIEFEGESWVPVDLLGRSVESSTLLLPLRSLVLVNTIFPQSCLEEVLTVTPRLLDLRLVRMSTVGRTVSSDSPITEETQFSWERLYRHLQGLPIRL
ncbi:hypothetical protein BGX29_011556 [Mortierella sp. GBA35]|nr:hypothetical protein BGX29_011556 [Mortierella sp. GBA35]